MDKANINAELDGLEDFWSQKVLAQANGSQFKVAKGTGATLWHSHDDQEEVFILYRGTLAVEMRDRTVTLAPGDIFVVPRGVEHRAVAEGEAHFLIVGRSITSTRQGGKPN